MSADLAGSTGLSAEAVFENRHAARFVFDPCADEIYEVNEAACSMLGYTRAELLQLGPSDLHPEEMESFRRFVAAARRHSEVWTDDLTCTTKTGRKIPVEMSLSEAKVEPTTTAPSEDTLVAVVRDVSDRIHQREQLQVLSRVLRHNLRNRMNVVLGHAELIRETDDETTVDASVDTIQETATKLMELSENVRVIRETMADPPAEDATVDAVEIVQSVVADAAYRYPTAEVTTDLPPARRVYGDEVLSTAVEQLVDNAVEHNDAATPWVGVSVVGPEQFGDDCVEIRVVDDGPGVPSDEQIVTEAGVSPTAVRHNSGMGLWTVSWIAQLCDGTLDIRERRGGDGTVAAIRLPANETTDCCPPERVDTGTDTDTLVDGDERDCVN